MSKKLTYEYVKEYIESYDGYKLLSEEYKNNSEKLKIQCPEGHIYEVTFGNFKSGQRCPVCYHQSTSSEPEKEIQEFIQFIYDEEIIKNDRSTIINPSTGRYLELDVYLPEINKAIEFNGSYWYSLPNNDKIKKEQCKRNNINLLVIDEENWMLDKETCLQAIENFINE